MGSAPAYNAALHRNFRQKVWQHYHAHARNHLPWRQLQAAGGGLDPYGVLVSEFMLQQTQVSRVAPKYVQFMRRFPNLQALACAPLAAVLQQWSGLGYNRRAQYLWHTAQQVVAEYNGQLPGTVDALRRLPGIGPNTAGAIVAYAFNQPAPFIETNIRTVYIHHFFSKAATVPDRAILSLVQRDLAATPNPRQWYWALMDYGTYLKQTHGNLSQKSSQYRPQPAFNGSRRQIRGQVLRLLATGPCSKQTLQKQIPDARLGEVLATLSQEGLIQKSAKTFRLPS